MYNVPQYHPVLSMYPDTSIYLLISFKNPAR